MKNGFTLLEVMITLAIISVIAVIAIPSYQSYTRKAHYTEIVQASAPYKLAVAECYHINGRLDQCSGGSEGIPMNVTSPSGNINSITTSNGVITVTPSDKNGLTTADTYILTPKLENDRLVWDRSGGGVTAGYAR